MAMFNCPKCYKTIAELPESGELIALCSNCRFKFQVVRGKVIERSSKQQPGRKSSPIRHYVFRIELPHRRTEVTEFDQTGTDEGIQARRGDDVAVVYSMRDTKREELLAVHNLTTGDSHAIGTPGQKASSTANTLGFMAGAAVGAICFAASIPFFFSAVLAGGTWAGAVYLLRQRLAPVHLLEPEAQALLERKHSWLSEKLRLEEARARVVGDIADRERLRQRLVDLRRKMLEVGLDAYKTRLASIDVALAALDRQMTLDLSLREGYDRSIKMIEIEQETSTANEVFPDDLTPLVLEKLDELKALEAKQADLARELEANVEIEQLLRPTRSSL